MKHKQVNFPFGHGLSYTTFEYSDLKITTENDRVNITVKVTNTGAVAGKETVQVYVQNQASSVETPVQELKAFKKVALEPKKVNLSL